MTARYRLDADRRQQSPQGGAMVRHGWPIPTSPPCAVRDGLVLSVAAATRSDSCAISAGVSGRQLMDRAGLAIAHRVLDGMVAPDWPVQILVGPGNNGGDGYIAARYLAEAGIRPQLLALHGRTPVHGDGEEAAQRWLASGGAIGHARPDHLADTGIVIDALFGAGLNRALQDEPGELIAALAARAETRRLRVIAADLPSGVSGDSGDLLGTVARAEISVTFSRPKAGHLLYPGRERCGKLFVADIGIPDSCLPSGGLAGPAMLFENMPDLWVKSMRMPRWDDHKYRRGVVLILGGAEMTGAARLAAQAARRVGAGLVRLAVPERVEAIYRADRPGLLVAALERECWSLLLADRRVGSVLLGPGAGRDDTLVKELYAAIRESPEDCRVVLDGDALTCLTATELAQLIAETKREVVITPHDGEYAALCRDVGGDCGPDRLCRARWLAELSGATVILKGPDTVIADAKGRAIIETRAPATLATAGSGDVLAGLCAGLLAQGMATLEAAACAVWLHSQAACMMGHGLIAEDLPEQIPKILNFLDGHR